MRGYGTRRPSWPKTTQRPRATSRVSVAPVYPRGPVAARREPLRLGLPRPDRESGRETVQLLRRTWRITDARGRTQRCMARAWWASSRCWSLARCSNTRPARRWTRRPASWSAPITWSAGSGEAFDVAIPAFSLDSPHDRQRCTDAAGRCRPDCGRARPRISLASEHASGTGRVGLSGAAFRSPSVDAAARARRRPRTRFARCCAGPATIPSARACAIRRARVVRSLRRVLCRLRR